MGKDATALARTDVACGLLRWTLVGRAMRRCAIRMETPNGRFCPVLGLSGAFGGSRQSDRIGAARS